MTSHDFPGPRLFPVEGEERINLRKAIAVIAAFVLAIVTVFIAAAVASPKRGNGFRTPSGNIA